MDFYFLSLCNFNYILFFLNVRLGWIFLLFYQFHFKNHIWSNKSDWQFYFNMQFLVKINVTFKKKFLPWFKNLVRDNGFFSDNKVWKKNFSCVDLNNYKIAFCLSQGFEILLQEVPIYFEKKILSQYSRFKKDQEKTYGT